VRGRARRHRSGRLGSLGVVLVRLRRRGSIRRSPGGPLSSHRRGDPRRGQLGRHTLQHRELEPFWGASLRFAIAAVLVASVMAAMNLRLPKGRLLAGANCVWPFPVRWRIRTLLLRTCRDSSRVGPDSAGPGSAGHPHPCRGAEVGTIASRCRLRCGVESRGCGHHVPGTLAVVCLLDFARCRVGKRHLFCPGRWSSSVACLLSILSLSTRLGWRSPCQFSLWSLCSEESDSPCPLSPKPGWRLATSPQSAPSLSSCFRSSWSNTGMRLAPLM
jgi:hypothetical protein